jgi:hypothetical protein
MKLCALLAVSPFFFAFGLAAQDSDVLLRGPDAGTQYFVKGIKVLPVSGRPFQGRSTTEWTRTLEDGTTVTTRLYAAVARDNQGRIFREVRSFIPASSTEGSKLKEIRIFDPVTRTRTYCKIATRQCNVSDYHAPTSFTPMPAGTFDDGKRYLVRETLGTDSIDGVNVIGTRETVIIAAGAVGNSRALITTRESWYSPELQVNLAVTRKDPREGTQMIRVSDLSVAEPDPAPFSVVSRRDRPAKPEN